MKMPEKGQPGQAGQPTPKSGTSLPPSPHLSPNSFGQSAGKPGDLQVTYARGMASRYLPGVSLVGQPEIQVVRPSARSAQGAQLGLLQQQFAAQAKFPASPPIPSPKAVNQGGERRVPQNGSL